LGDRPVRVVAPLLADPGAFAGELRSAIGADLPA
jgi:hypothetical protein